MKRPVFVIVFALVCLAAPSLRAERFGAVSVENVPQAAGVEWQSSYFVREFRVENAGGRPAEVRICIRSAGDTPFSTERSVLIAPGAVQNVVLYRPPADAGGRYSESLQMELVIDGRPVKHSLLPDAGSSISYKRSGILLSGSLPLHEYRPFFRLDRYGRSLESSNIPVVQWGRNLRDYAGLRSIWISSEDVVPPEVEAALMKWVFSGGTLVICVPPGSPWPEGTEGPDGEPAVRQHGWGRRVVCRPVPAEKCAAVEAYLKRYADHEGKGEENKLNGLKRPELGGGMALLDSLASNDEFFARPQPQSFHDELGLEIPTVPLQLLFYVMLVFVIVIGPVNFLVLRKFRKEPLILLTTPAVSLLFCLLVVGFITLSEGWYSRAKAFGVTLLDQEGRQAATLARLGVYAPIAPGGGFIFDSGDLLEFAHAGAVLANVDTAQKLASGLLQPRIPLCYSVVRVSPQREKLRIAPEKDGLAVVNGLGARLNALLVAGPDGGIFVSDSPVEPGERVLLRRGKQQGSVRKMDMARLYRAAQLAVREKRCDPVSGELPPGYYCALAEEPLFYTPGFWPDRFEARHAVIGKYSFAGESEDGN